MTLDLLALVSGMLLSLAFSYIKGLRNKFKQFAPETKRLIMLGLLLVVTGGVYALSCAGWLQQLWPQIAVTCDQRGLFSLVQIFILAAISNQSAYALSPLPKEPVEAAK